MSDKIWLAYSLLGELSTASWGCITYDGGTFKLDIPKWYNKLRIAANEGANLCRVLPFSLFGNQLPEAVFQPFVYVGNGQWDLSQFNSQYFAIMKEAIEIAKSIGITIWLELFDNCGLWPEIEHLNPMTHNVQGRTDYYAADEYARAWVGKCLMEFGNSVKYGLGNELTDHLMVASILPTFKAYGTVPFSYGADLDIAGEENHNSVRKFQSLAVEDIWGENEKIQLFHCCHKAYNWLSERVTKPVYWWKFHSIQFSDDGGFPRPQGAEWAETVEYVLNNQNIEVPQYGQGGKARLMFEVCPETENAHLIIRDIVTVCEVHGVTFENKGKYPNDYVPPVPDDPDDPPEPGCKITWQGWIGIGLLCAALIVAAIIIF